MAMTYPAIGTAVNIISMVASFAVAAAVLLLWSRRSIALNVPLAYRRVFPIVVLSFLFLPLLPEQNVIWLAGVMYAPHSVAILLMMIQCAPISLDRGINPVFIYGLFGGIMYALHDLGFIIGSSATVMSVPSLSSPAMIALVSVSTLSILALIGTPPPRGTTLRADGNSIELLNQTSLPDEESMALAEAAVAADEREEATAENSTAVDDDTQISAPIEPSPYHDRLSMQVELMRIDYKLSAREAEVAEMLARGQTVARIAEMLFVSENTVRTHSKRIYAKLDVHKKQQLRDLVESYDPNELR